MIFLVLLLLPVLEIYVLYKVGSTYGYINAVFALVAAGILGAGFAKAQGRYVVQNMQLTLARGQVPGNQLVHALLLLMGGILFLIPGFISDFIGLFFVLPGTRHLIALYLKARFAKRIASGGTGGFRVFTAGFGGPNPFGGAGPQGQNPFEGFQAERDVTSPKLETNQSFQASSEDNSNVVIDVTPEPSSDDRPKKS